MPKARHSRRPIDTVARGWTSPARCPCFLRGLAGFSAVQATPTRNWYGGCEERRNHATNRAERRTEDEAMLVEAPAGDGDAACASRHGRGGRRREELQLPAGRHRRGVPGHDGAHEGRQTRDRET